MQLPSAYFDAIRNLFLSLLVDARTYRKFPRSYFSPGFINRTRAKLEGEAMQLPALRELPVIQQWQEVTGFCFLLSASCRIYCVNMTC